MITTVTRQVQDRPSWRTGRAEVRTVEHTQIEGTVTAVNETDDRPGRAIVTVDAGETVTVLHVSGLADDMTPVHVGDRVRILANQSKGAADYVTSSLHNSVTRI